MASPLLAQKVSMQGRRAYLTVALHVMTRAHTGIPHSHRVSHAHTALRFSLQRPKELAEELLVG